MVGNTVVDALLYARAKIGNDYQPIDAGVSALPTDKKLVLATMHRRENIGAPMRNVLRALRTLAGDGDKVIALPVHLNPQVRGDVLNYLGDAPNVHLLSPLQYPDFVYLLNRAWTVVTDSGGVQEEAPDIRPADPHHAREHRASRGRRGRLRKARRLRLQRHRQWRARADGQRRAQVDQCPEPIWTR